MLVLRALSVEAAKLVAGSCLQLVFQAVLLGAFTPWKYFKVSQAISILSSALMITKVALEIVIFQRENPKPEPTEEYKTIKEKIRELAVELMDTLKKFLVALPLLLSSLVFNTGTLILTIIVTEWASAVYIVLVLLLNMIISLIYPHSTVAAVEKKLKLIYKFSKLDEEQEAKKVRDTRIVRGLFTTWANLFILLRPVENMSYHKITHVGLLQPIRFIVNIATLLILVGLTWTPPYNHTQVQEISLIVSFCVVFAAGLVNMLELFCYFFFGNHFCLSKPPPKDNVVEMQGMEKDKVKSDLESTTTSIHSMKDFENATKDEKTSLLSEIGSSVKDMTKNEEAYHNKASDISPEGVKRKEPDETADDTDDTDKEEEAESEETGDISAKASNALQTSMSDPTELRPAVRRLMTQVSVRSVKEVFNNDDIVDPNSELTKDEVNEKIMNVQEKGMVDKESFIADMMSFFPNYNAESNKTKLGKLFDRLDDVSGSRSGFITSRQYMLVTIAFSNRTLTDKLTKIFTLIDENGDEELTFEEFDDVVNDILVLKAEKKLSASLMKGRFSENMFRDMGVNTEGKINLRAFVDACTKHRFIIINYVENFREGFIIANEIEGEEGGEGD